MEIQKTKEFAKQWIEDNRPCVYRYGFAFKGASTKRITKEEALNLLPSYHFGIGFYEIGFIEFEGEMVLKFNEFGENDLY